MNNKIKNIIRKSKGKKVDGFLVTKITNIQYLTGFTGSTAYLLITKEKSFFITDSRYIEQAKSEVKGCEIIEAKDYFANICKTVRQNKIKKLGFEYNNLTFSQYESLKKKLKRAKLIGLKNTIEDLRVVKSPEEIGYIKKAVEIAELAFKKTLYKIKEGITEREVACELE